MLLKTKPVRSKKHLEHLRGMPCMLCRAPGEAHHLLRAGGKGMGMKAGDDKCVPLCHDHHMQLHGNGDERDFFELHGWEYEKVVHLAEVLYQQTLEGVDYV